MPSDLVIKVAGDVTSFKSALEEAEKKTEDLGDGLETMAKSASVALAALTAEAFLAVHAFGESQQSSNRLTASLQQQGIYTKELADSYKEIAAAIQLKTGVDDDEVIAAMTSAQNMLGQTKITKELAGAVSDLAAAKGIDLKQAYDLVAKAATVNTEILKRYGIEVVDTGDKAKNLAAIQEKLSIKFGGQAEAAAQGLGGIKLLKATFGDLQEEIGGRLAPAFELLIQKTTAILKFVQENKAMVDFIVSIGIAGAAVSAAAIAVAAGGLAFLKLTAVLEAAQIATSAMTIATRGLVAATGLGLLITVATLVALNWDSIWPRVQGVFFGFVEAVSGAAQGLGNILMSALTLDPSQLTKGIEQVGAAIQKGLKKYSEVVDTARAEQNQKEDADEQAKVEKNNKRAAEEEARARRKAALLFAIENEKRQLIVAQVEKESDDSIKLRQEAIALEEAMVDEHNLKIVGVLQARLETVRKLQADQAAEDLQKQVQLNESLLLNNQEYAKLTDDEKAEFLEKNYRALLAEVQTESAVREAAAADRAKLQTKENNDFLLAQQKFGTAYATINRIMHSEVVQGAAKGFAELAALQQSSNSTLKAIGKAAALVNIAVQTAQSAMNIFAGFSTIPIIGPALGTAGAAAAVAFGAEQAGKVMAAADGGLLTGGIPGRDSIPVLGMPGELVVPTRNFDEVVGSVAASRAGGGVGSEGGFVNVVLSLKDGLYDLIEANMIERDNLGLSIRRA